MSRTFKTEEGYEKDAGRIKAKYESVCLLSNTEESIETYEAFLNDEAKKWNAATCRKRRAALTYSISKKLAWAKRRNNQKLVGELEGKLSVIEKLLPGKQDDAPKSTSALKLKKLPLKQWAYVQDKLGDSSSEYAKLTTLLVFCGEVIGARPAEWMDASIVKNEQGMSGVKFQNAKATNGRACGAERIVWLTEETPENVLTACEILVNVIADKLRNKARTWESIYENSRKLLSRCQDSSPFKRKISFYTARHQFTANAKADRYSPTEIAALMGHLSVKTSGTHYGRRTAGRGGSKVKADKVNREVVKAHMVENNITSADLSFQPVTDNQAPMKGEK